MTTDRLPPFASVLKSREVEDPVNMWIHRPLAYLFVRLIHRTSITPNQVTYFATIVGIAAGVCWLIGTSQLMLLGGLLLWSSAILDGADGILARAKNIQSAVGRAIDGAADGLVALATVGAGFYHVLITDPRPYYPILMLVALVTAVAQVYLYDFYRESYLQNVNPDWNGVPEYVADVKARYESLKRQRGSWAGIVATNMYIGIKSGEAFMVALTNPKASQENMRYIVNEKTVDIYRRYNRGPIQLWMWLSTAPHSYLMAICGMFDRLDLYLWLRVVVANAIFIVVLIWQNVASNRTRRELENIGAAPVPVTEL
ncbi:MAG: CDP-alcohol phosphatidyltransferase family protein [Deltaproteobacteria bacterium]|nr:CDP-alcohol phosphatidyltransferase family protein [Deltaproteobacteria bacterium]